MKKEIHPQYGETKVTCGCGETFTTRSTVSSGSIYVEVCSVCHPFYTGKQRILDTGGRVAKFEERFGKSGVKQLSKKTAFVTSVTAAVFFFPNVDSMFVHVHKEARISAMSNNDRFALAHELVSEYAVLEAQMADPDIHNDQGRARQLGRRYAQLGPVVAGFREWRLAEDDLAAAKELAEIDTEFASEIAGLEEVRDVAATKLEELLLPRDPNDDRDVILEIKAGAGGDESALFAGDLLRMYLRYAEKQGWKTEVIDATESDLGGYKDISVGVKSKGVAEPGKSPYARLKFEGGVHRVQRVPETESQGRIHTSAAGVMVLPEAEEVDVEINMNDLRIDVYRSSGPGGQSVNTTDSAVRITHIPTGIVVSCQNEKSQLQNKESALRILRARMLLAAQEAAQEAASAERNSQVRTVDRSERIRTYNFPENRISDHRVNFKSNNLDAVLNGELDPMIQALLDADKAAKLASTK